MLQNSDYIRFSAEHCVEVMCMKDIERAVAEKPAHAATYRVKDPYGDEVECFEAVPGVTVDQLKELHEGEALNYMQGPLMPYTAVVDPHTLEDLGGIERGQATTAKEFIAVIGRHAKALREAHGPGVERKLWTFVRDAQVEVDLLLGEGKLREALSLLEEMEARSARQPEALRRKVEATREVVLADAADRLDALERQAAEGKRNEARRELAKLARLLEGTPLAERAAALRDALDKK